MRPRALVSLAAVAALLLSTGRASADLLSLRYGGGVEGGPFIVPGLMTLGFFGPHVHVGVRLPFFFSLSAVGNFDYIVGKLHGPYPTGALVVQNRFADRFTVGVGAEVGYYVVNPKAEFNTSFDRGFLYGGRLHFSWHAARWWSDNFVRVGQGYFTLYENLLTLSFDLRLVGRPAGFTGVWDPSGTASPSTIALLPTLNLGLVISSTSN